MVRRIAMLALLAIAAAACGASPTPTGAGAASSALPGTAASVARVVDGDTLKARIAGRTETVRVIGLDTPESVKPGTPVECYALRASAEAERLLPVGAAIHLEADPTQATRDQYGRLLAHVWLADGTLYAERMIRGGFGIHYVYGGVPSIHARPFAAAEDAARAALSGLWSPIHLCGQRPHGRAVAESGAVPVPAVAGRRSRCYHAPKSSRDGGSVQRSPKGASWRTRRRRS